MHKDYRLYTEFGSLLPNRKDYIYTKMESFKDYEYTTCIAYEMGIRNKDVQRIIAKLTTIEDLRRKIIIRKNLYLSKRENNPYFVKYKLLTNNIVTSKLERDLREKFLIYPKYTDIFGNELSHSLSKGYPYKRHFSDLKYQYSFQKIFKQRSYKLNEVEFDGFYIAQGIDAKFDHFDVNTLTSNFKRKIYNTNKTNVILNLSLPEEELTAYIKHIKTSLDKSEKVKLKTPTELLGKLLDKAIEPKSLKKIPSGKKARISAMINAFHAYDFHTTLASLCKKEQKKLRQKRDKEIQDINISLDYDKNQKKINIENISTTYKNEISQYNRSSQELLYELMYKTRSEVYVTLMNSYINKLKYKELITGKSIT